MQRSKARTIKWDISGQSFTLTYGSVRGRHIDLECLRRQVVQEGCELMAELCKVADLDMKSFSLSQISDDAGLSTSLFDDERNIAIFRPYIKHVYAYLRNGNGGKPGTMNTTRTTHFMVQTRKFLQMIAAHLYRTSGIPPRAWQTVQFLYRSFGQYLRNLRLLPSSLPFIGNPKAKQMDRLIYDAFWLLPPHLGIALIFYLGVFRPVEIAILESRGIPTEQHRHYIFVSTQRPTNGSYIWKTSHLNKVLQAGTTPELSYMAATYRNVMQAIVDKHFSNLHPHTFPRILQEASNGQAQHQARTHDTSYAVDEISDGVGLPLSARDRQFLVSRAFHVWYRFTPEDHDWCQYQNYHPNEVMESHMKLALMRARPMVIEEYGFARSKISCEDRARLVGRVIEKKPFLYGKQVSLN